MRRILTALLLLCPLLLAAQGGRTIKGRVLDKEGGDPLPGASVYIEKSTIGAETGVKGVIENTSIGTVTNIEGFFELGVPASVEQLVVSFLGYESQKVSLNGTTDLVVRLSKNENALSEVIITGYNRIDRRKLTSAVTTVDAVAIKQAGVASVDQMLQGQVAGLVATPTNGAPGSPARIRIRGTASLSGPQDPLWVVDGMPLEGNDIPANFSDKDNIDQLQNFSIAGLNPNDIEGITILKDAAATAIYGARAANGVIVVTTKSGRRGKMRVNVSANTFITQRPDFDKLNLLDSSEKVDLELALAGREDLTYRSGKGAVARILNRYGALSNFQVNGLSAIDLVAQAEIAALRDQQTNWGDELYRTAVNQQYGISLSGGSDKADYYFSGGYFNEKGTTVGTGLERYNITLKNTFRLSPRLTVGAAVFGTRSERKSYVTDTDAFTNPAYYSRNANPYLAIRDAAGNYVYDPDIEGYSDTYIPFNFMEERENTSYSLNNRALKALFDVDYQLLPDLNLTSQLGLQLENTNTEKYAGQESYYVRKEREKTRRYNSAIKDYYYFMPEGGIIQNFENEFFQYNWKTMLSFDKTLGGKHSIEAMAGTELRRTDNRSINTKGFGFDPKTLTTKPIIFPNQDAANESAYRMFQKSQVENAFASFFGTASYTYDYRYTFFGSVRYDGSDLFGVDPEYKFLPLWAVSGAWNVTEEKFMKGLPWLSNLRLRASYGLQGNIDKNTSPFIMGNYGNTNILPGNTEETIVVTSPPNDRLRWEKTKTINLGLDFGVYRDAVMLRLDAYHRKSSDLIGMRSIPLENGFEFTNLNWAQVSNKGVEVTLSTRNIAAKNFRWTTDFNISRNESRVDKIEVRENELLPSRQGYPINAVFAIPTAGVDASGMPLFWQKGEKVSAQQFYQLYDPYAEFFPGYFVNSDLSNKDFRNLYNYAGDADPKYTGGFINRFSYKNLDLTISSSFSLKQAVLASAPYDFAQVDPGKNYTNTILNAWSPANAGSALPGIIGEADGSGDDWMLYPWFSGGDPTSSYQKFDTWVKEMSYLRVSSIRLGYTLPEAVAGVLRISNLRLSVESRNPFVVATNYDGYFDPETYGNLYAQPIPKTFTIGVEASF